MLSRCSPCPRRGVWRWLSCLAHRLQKMKPAQPQQQCACLPRRLTRRVAHFFRVGSHARLLLLAFAVIFFHLWTSIFQTMVFTLPNFNDVLAFSLFESSFSTLLTGCYMVYTGTQHKVQHGAKEENTCDLSSRVQEVISTKIEQPGCGADKSNQTAANSVPAEEPAYMTSCETSDASAMHSTCVPIKDTQEEDKHTTRQYNTNNDSVEDTPLASRDMPLFHRSQVSLRMYFVIALFMSASLFLTNEASYILSFPVQVTLKSTKLLFTAVAHRCFLSDMDNNNTTNTKISCRNDCVGDALTGVSYHTTTTNKNNKTVKPKKKKSGDEERGNEEEEDDDDEEDARSDRSREEATNTVIDVAEDDVGMRGAVQRTKAGHARRAQYMNHPHSVVIAQNTKSGWSWRAKAAHAVRHGSRLRHWLRQAYVYLAKRVGSLRRSDNTNGHKAHVASAVSTNGSFTQTAHNNNTITTAFCTGHHRSSSYNYNTDNVSTGALGEAAVHKGPISKRESKRTRLIASFCSRPLHALYKVTCRLVQMCTRDAEIASCTLIVVGVILFMYAEQGERETNGGHRVGAVDLSDGIRANPLYDKAGNTPLLLATRDTREGKMKEGGSGVQNHTSNTNTRKKASRTTGLAYNETNCSSTSKMYNESWLTRRATPFTGKHNRSTLREAVEMDGDITALRAAKAAAAQAAAQAATTNTHRVSSRTAAEETSSQGVHKNTTHTSYYTNDTNTSIHTYTDNPLPVTPPDLLEWDEGPSLPRGLLPLNTFLAVMCVLFSNVLDACMYILEEKYCVPRGDDDEDNNNNNSNKKEKKEREKKVDEVGSTSTHSATSRKNAEQTEAQRNTVTEEKRSAMQSTEAAAPATNTKDIPSSITTSLHTPPPPSPPRTSCSAKPYLRPARASFEELLFFVNLFTALVYCVAWPLAWSPSLSPRQLSLYLTALPDNLYYTNINITPSTSNSIRNASLLHYELYGGNESMNRTGEMMSYTAAAQQVEKKSTVLRPNAAVAPQTMRTLAQQEHLLVTDTLNRTAHAPQDMRCGKGREDENDAVCTPGTPLPRPTRSTTRAATTTTAAPRRRRRRLRRRRVTKNTQTDTTATTQKKKKKKNNNNNRRDEANASPAQGRIYGANITAAQHLLTLQLTNTMYTEGNGNDEDDQWEFYEDDEFNGYSKVFILCFLSASCGLAGTTMLLWIIAEHSSTTAVLITCVRKTITVICTYFFYDTSFSLLHFVGLVIVMTGVWWYDLVRRTLED